MRMDEGMDTGPVLLQAPERIRDDDDAGTLGGRLAALGGGLLVETLDRLERGDLDERPQDEAGATMAPKLKPEEEWIDWTEDADAIVRRVRALAPDPGARTRFRDRVVKVLRVAPAEAEGVGAAGTVLRMSKQELVVAAGQGALSIHEVVPEGRKPMTGADFARGSRPEVGERFG
jgi:methionyl-tRNA formyltransferase